MEERTHHGPDVPPVDLPTGAQIPLPFDDEAEDPIPFALTARARRTVAPHAVPALRVITAPPSVDPDPGAARAGAATSATGGPALADVGAHAVIGDDPSDTRPARARALRRSGRAHADIASELGVDELLVRAWTGHVPVARPSGRSGRSARATSGVAGVAGVAGVSAAGGAGPAAAGAAPSVPVPLRRFEGVEDGGPHGRHEVARRTFERVRDATRASAAARLAEDPALSAGLGVLAGVADLSPTAIDVTTSDPRVAGAVVRWVTSVLGADRDEVRLVLRVGPRAAADLARHRWAQATGIPAERIRTTRAVARTVTRTDDDTVEGMLRLVDADLAAAAAGWRDALLDGGGVRDHAF